MVLALCGLCPRRHKPTGSRDEFFEIIEAGRSAGDLLPGGRKGWFRKMLGDALLPVLPRSLANAALPHQKRLLIR